MKNSNAAEGLSVACLLKRYFVLTLLCGAAGQASALVIGEFRLRGPNGPTDEYIKLYNDSDAALVVAATDASAGFAVGASDGISRCTVPNGTVIPARGYYLCTNSVGYSIAAHPAGNGTTATGDATFATDIPDNAGIALFSSADPLNFSLGTRLDAVGSTSEANALFREGAGYPALTPFSIDYAFTRDSCGKGGSITTPGACPTGVPVDTGNNAADFVFVDTNGTSAGAGQRLGAPGPANLSSPVIGGSVTQSTFDGCIPATAGPNVVRDLTSDPANNSTFGTLDIRNTFTNTSGVALTRLRFRVIDLTTFPAPAGFADLRPRTSGPLVVNVDRAPCGVGTSNVAVEGTTLEQPPSQPNGGGFNSSLSAGAVTLGTPLAPGASLDLRFLLGIQQTGRYKLGVAIEGLPQGGSLVYIQGATDGPQVLTINRVDPDPTTASSVQFTVTFDQPVTGVDVTDFVLATTGAVAGATVTSVAGVGTTYTVTVNTGNGNGTLRLDVVDDDTIVNGGRPLGGAGAGNGEFTTGQVYTINKVIAPVAATTPVPTLNEYALILLALAVGGMAAWQQRRRG